MTTFNNQEYIDHYLNIKDVYPSVFSLKMFLGNNPNLDLRDKDFSNKKILDIGFGDGRDLFLFSKLGFQSYGVEVDEDVVNHTSSKFKSIKNIKLSLGYNDKTGFEPNTFDYVYSVAALMYLRNESLNIHNILNHSFDILKVGGMFMGTFARFDSHVVKDSTKVDKHRIILKDPYYKFREGQLYHIYFSKNELEKDLVNVGFKKIKIFDYDVDWFGTRETFFMFTAQK